MPCTRRFRILYPAVLGFAAALSVGGAASALAGDGPVAVSPGSAAGTVISDRCPTFNWGIVEGAQGYELVIYQVEEDREDTKPVLRQSFPGTANGWTPSLDRCLERGGRYAWSIRAVGGKAASEWSPPSLFEVSGGPSEVEFEEALAVVRRYLAQGEPGAPNPPPPADRAVSGEVREGSRTSSEDAADCPLCPQGVVISNDAITISGRPVVTQSVKRVFITSTTYNGGLGGLAGADAKCNERASVVGLPGSFKAWLSVPTCGVADACRSFTQHDGPYIRMDNALLANDWTDLTDGDLANLIDVDEFGNDATANFVWSATNADGTPKNAGDSCLGWDWVTGGFNGMVGCVNLLGPTWSDCGIPKSCGEQHALYCFQQ